jgi:hypothetical protein
MLSLTADPRTINEADFPMAATPEEQWLLLINYALLAPAEYNIQPWQFLVQGILSHCFWMRPDVCRSSIPMVEKC